MKGFWTQKASKHLKEERVKENKGLYEVKNEGVHCKKYDRCYMKQWIRIPTIT
jgi:hypothetical protein